MKDLLLLLRKVWRIGKSIKFYNTFYINGRFFVLFFGDIWVFYLAKNAIAFDLGLGLFGVFF